MAPRNLEEQLVSGSIIAIYPLFFLGGLYIWGPALAWLLLCVFGIRWLFNHAKGPNGLIWIWIGSSFTLLFALLVGHLTADLGFMKLVKSSIGWAKGWALFPLFILAGFALNIRFQVISRASCWLGLQTVIFLIISLLAVPIGLEHLYTSPLKILGGADDQYFAVGLYAVNPESGLPRWRFFAPWAPAASLVGTLIFVCAWYEEHKLWRLVGLLGALCLVVFCQSRLGWLVLPITIVILSLENLIRSGHTWLLLATTGAGVILASPFLFEQLLEFKSAIENARPDSTRVRGALAQIAVQRWSDEAPWFGHGTVERGPHAVEYMAIGSHHTWYGLLFVKGVVGFLAFAIPLVATIIWLSVRSVFSKAAWTGLALLLPVCVYSFTENLEMLAYLIWPGLISLGVCLAQASQLEKSHEKV
ncbi:MAG: O-antigen ligase domain-containing protein [Pseudomonadota bacterium]